MLYLVDPNRPDELEEVGRLNERMVRRALEQTKGRVEEASRVLGISRKGLFLKRRRMGLRQLT